MYCKNCKNENAHRMRITKEGEWCEICAYLPPKSLADVYFKEPYLDPHLVDINDKRQKDGVWVESREHKRKLLDKLNLRESGDRVHGARTEYRPRDNGGWNNV